MPIVIVPPIDGSPIPPGPTPSSVLVTPQPAPLLSLDAFRQIIGYNPYHFWGLANSLVPVNTQCNTVVTQYGYQSAQAAGRFEISQAIIKAQETLRGYLQYPVAPTYIETIVPYTKFLDQRIVRTWPADPTGGWVSVQAPDGKIEAMGIESLTLLDTVAVTYSDVYSSGLNDTFTVSVATTETDANKLAVYFSQADRLDNEAVGAAWRIEPVNVSADGTTAVITGRAWLLVKPSKYQKFTNMGPLNPSDSSNFVTTLEIYLRETDPDGVTDDTAMGTFVWDSIPNLGWWGFCCQNSTDPAAIAQSIARVGIRNNELGIVFPGQAIYNTTSQTWVMTVPPWWNLCHPPDKVKLRYLAGYPLEANGQMNSRLARAVAYLAMAELAERICACDAANRVIYRHQLPLNQTGADQETFATTRQMLENPFGNRYGSWAAWNEIKQLRLVRGTSAG